MYKGRPKQIAAVFVVAVSILLLPHAAFAAASVSVAIESPADGAVITLAQGESTADVPVSGTASVADDGGGKNTTLVYTLDRSSSMNTTAGVNCNQAAGNDSRFVCLKEGVKAANATAASASSAIAKAGVAAFDAAGSTHDVDLGATGKQVLVAPGHDGNNNSTADVVDATNALTTGAGTSYGAGLSATISILQDASNNQPHNLVIFLSDGRNNTSPAVNTVTIPPNTLIKTFALGNDVVCSDAERSLAGGGSGDLQDVANLSTEGPGAGNTQGVCKVVTDMSKLGEEITTAISATLDSLTWTLDGGAQQSIPNSGIDPDLPQTAPKTVNYNFTANDLVEGKHKICVQAHGTSGATPLNGEDCVEIEIVHVDPIDPCTAENDDPGLLTDDTLGQTLWDGGLKLSPLTEDPDRDGIISGPVGELFEGTPLEVIGDEVACLLDLLIDQEVFPIDL